MNINTPDHPNPRSPQITQAAKRALMLWNSVISNYINIYLYIYKTETAIFIIAKHEKNNYDGSYLNLYKYFLQFELLAAML